MAKGMPFTIADLEAKGFKDDGTGSYAFRGFDAKDVERAVLKLATASITSLKKLPKPKPIGLIAIENVLRASGVPFINEHQFTSTRRYRFDVAVPSMMLAVEYEGIFSNDNGQNGHTGVKAYVKDCEKYNLATVQGWKVLRYTAKNYKHFIDDFKQLLTYKP
jgi:hypothetical protein